MPLCNTEVEQVTEDDLIELSEIQKRNLGQVSFCPPIISLVCVNGVAATDWLSIKLSNLQALHIDAMSEVDNTTQSLLSFVGNKSVHGLYDFLLNYK